MWHTHTHIHSRECCQEEACKGHQQQSRGKIGPKQDGEQPSSSSLEVVKRERDRAHSLLRSSCRRTKDLLKEETILGKEEDYLDWEFKWNSFIQSVSYECVLFLEINFIVKSLEKGVFSFFIVIKIFIAYTTLINQVTS